MQIKITMIFHFMPTSVILLKRTKIIHIDKEVKKFEILDIHGRNGKSCYCYEKFW